MEQHHIQEARKVLSACGFMHTDKGGLYVPLERKFLLPMVLQPNQTAVFTFEVTGDTVWSMRAISCDQGMASVTGVRLQIQLPNGRFIFGGNGIDVGQFAWVAGVTAEEPLRESTVGAFEKARCGWRGGDFIPQAEGALNDVKYWGHCCNCWKTVAFSGSARLAATTVLRRLTVEHQKVSPSCHSGALELPMIGGRFPGRFRKRKVAA